MDKLTHIFQHLRHRLTPKRVGKREGISPERDWRALLLIAGGILLLACGYATYLYQGVSRGDIYEQSVRADAPLDTIDRTLLETATDGFTAKDLRASELRRVRPNFVDPSL